MSWMWLTRPSLPAIFWLCGICSLMPWGGYSGGCTGKCGCQYRFALPWNYVHWSHWARVGLWTFSKYRTQRNAGYRFRLWRLPSAGSNAIMFHGSMAPDHVAQIITFGTLGARAALRDVDVRLGMSYGDVWPRSPVNSFWSGRWHWERAIEINAELREIYQAALYYP